MNSRSSMAEELKLKIRDFNVVEDQLLRAGAVFSREILCRDTHFRTPSGRVLKIAENGGEGIFLVDLELCDGRFKIVSNEPIVDLDETKRALDEQFGIRRVIPKRRRFFELDGKKIQICRVDNLGDFLIVEGENLSREFIIEKLGIKDPEFVAVSFDELFDQLEERNHDSVDEWKF